VIWAQSAMCKAQSQFWKVPELHKLQSAKRKEQSAKRQAQSSE